MRTLNSLPPKSKRQSREQCCSESLNAAKWLVRRLLVVRAHVLQSLIWRILSDLQVELDISQTDFARLKMGQRAEIIPEAFPNLRYTGFIAEIAPEANRAKSTVQVKVKVENPNEQLRPEMNARVNFLSDKATSNTDNKAASRVMVPKAAVVRKDGTAFVFVVKGNKVEQRVIRQATRSVTLMSCWMV